MLQAFAKKGTQVTGNQNMQTWKHRNSSKLHASLKRTYDPEHQIMKSETQYKGKPWCTEEEGKWYETNKLKVHVKEILITSTSKIKAAERHNHSKYVIAIRRVQLYGTG